MNVNVTCKFFKMCSTISANVNALRTNWDEDIAFLSSTPEDHIMMWDLTL